MFYLFRIRKTGLGPTLNAFMYYAISLMSVPEKTVDRVKKVRVKVNKSSGGRLGHISCDLGFLADGWY